MSATLSITEAFELHLKERLLMENRSLKTVESYDNACKLLTRRFGDIPINELSMRHVTAWREWLASYQKQDTVKGNISCLRMVLKFLRQKEYPVLNYDEIKVPLREKRTIKYLTEEQIRDLIFEVGRPRRGYSRQNRLRNVIIIHLIYATGLRNSELCALDRDTIRNRQFTVVGKSKNPHIAFIDEVTECLLNEYLETRTDGNPAMFISHHTGKRINSRILRNIFELIRSWSNKFNGVTPHTIRHSYGTKMLRRRVDLRYIGDLMGHESLDTTRLYTHYENPQLKEVYDNAHAISVLT